MYSRSQELLYSLSSSSSSRSRVGLEIPACPQHPFALYTISMTALIIIIVITIIIIIIMTIMTIIIIIIIIIKTEIYFWIVPI